MNRLSSLAALVALAAACGSPPPPPRRAPAQPATPKVADETDTTQQQTMYVYSPIGKRDPFENTTAARGEDRTARPEGRKATPLQKWSLDQLRLAMTVTGTASPMAMLEAPDERHSGWPVHIGDFVGKNWGKVTSIQRNQIVVTETITDRNTGRVYPQNITIEVPQSKDEQSDLKALQEGEEMVPSPQTAPGSR
jgi:type IV pilus assembly protein PilP